MQIPTLKSVSSNLASVMWVVNRATPSDLSDEHRTLSTFHMAIQKKNYLFVYFHFRELGFLPHYTLTTV